MKVKRYTYSYKSDTVRVHIGKQSWLSIPVYVVKQWFEVLDKLNLDTYFVELDVDSDYIDIIPIENDSQSEDSYGLVTNGSGSGRRVTLPKYIIEKFGYVDGYYRVYVKDNGVLHIALTERVK